MKTTPTLPELAERDATGRTAEIYADIRATLDLPLVNLIWRHLATTEGALETTWAVARPLYASGAAEREANAFLAVLPIPPVTETPDGVLDLCGVGARDRTTIRALIQAYNRGNALNLITMHALTIEPTTASAASGAERPGGGSDAESAPFDPRMSEPDSRVPLPPVPAMSALNREALDTVMRLNRFGTTRDPGDLVATLYRHLACWPGYLGLVYALLEPMHRSGELRASVAETLSRAKPHAERAAHHRGDWPATDAARWSQRAIAFFVEAAISRMVPVGLLLERSLSLAPSPGRTQGA